LKPPLVSGKEICAVLERAGFRFVHQRGSHAKYRHDERGRTVIVVMDSEVDRWTLKGMLRDAGISVAEFVRLLGK